MFARTAETGTVYSPAVSRNQPSESSAGPWCVVDGRCVHATLGIVVTPTRTHDLAHDPSLLCEALNRVYANKP